MKRPVNDKISQRLRTRLKIPRGVLVAVYVFPAVLVTLFYILRPVRNAMDWFSVYIALPIRHFLGMIFSIYPIAIMEILCTAAGVFLIYYIIKAIKDSSRRRNKWKLLGKRGFHILVMLCYAYGVFCWLWSSGYHAVGMTEKLGFESSGVETSGLIAVTEMFAKGANELSAELERDEAGNIIINRSQMFTESRQIYKNIAGRFPTLGSTIYAPKPMYLYSWLMTITGYTGMYFALTGEAMVNTQVHPAFLPATVAHEHAHQLGVFAEDEANFFSILACVTSGNPTFEYAGYLSGLGYLSNALLRTDSDEYTRIMSSLNYNVRHDRYQNAEFWAQSTTSTLGIDFLDNFFTTIMDASNAAVDSAYDGYLRSQNQKLGIQSYGACVDLLVEYFTRFPVEREREQEQ